MAYHLLNGILGFYKEGGKDGGKDRRGPLQ